MNPYRETGPSSEATEVHERQYRITLSRPEALQALARAACDLNGLNYDDSRITTETHVFERADGYGDPETQFLVVITEDLLRPPIPDEAPQDPDAFRLIKAAPRKLSEPTSFEIHPTITVDDIVRYRESLPRFTGDNQ